MLIKERKRLFEKLVEAQRERSKAEMMLASAANKNSVGEGASKRETFDIFLCCHNANKREKSDCLKSWSKHNVNVPKQR